MSKDLQTAERTSPSIPDDLYISLVQALFADKKALILGSLSTGICGAVAVCVTASWLVAIVALTMGAVAIWRITDFSRFRKLHKTWDLSVMRSWEVRYTIGASAYMALLGVWTFSVFVTSDDAFPRLLALSATLGHALGIATRNFSFVRGTNAQLVSALIPLCATFAFANGRYLAFIPLVIVPILIFIKGSASRLRATFLEANLLARDKSVLANRFDTALNNMSHGLCMLDAEGKIDIINEKLLTLLSISRADITPGLSFMAALRLVVRNGKVSAVNSRRLSRLIRNRDDHPPMLIDYNGDQAAEVTVRRMETGGSIIVIQDVTERRNSERLIDRMAHVDSVTDLANRRRFEDELSLALKAYEKLGQQTAILFLDLDDFKQVNDSFGHAKGDALLRIIAERLTALIAPNDLVARWGGDEFAILVRSNTSLEHLAHLADGIIQDVARPCSLGDTEHVVGVSLGIAIAPTDGLEAHILLSKADIALYAAKSSGRNQWRAFVGEMEDALKRRRLLEMALRTAIANDEIDIYYQPIVAVETSEVVGLEALARWNHPTHGFISPGEFIPLVEELGLMNVMGASILRRACAFCSTLPGDIRISVNLSPTQFWGGDIVNTVRQILQDTGLPSYRLDLEITESVLLDDRPTTRSAITALREMGVKVALDDFGTGYSSLAYLLTVPIDRIKIDRAFTVGLGIHKPAAVLIDGVAEMSRRLGIEVVVEGVETADQFRKIAALKSIEEAQGFLFSAAVPAAKVPALLQQAKKVFAA